MICVSTSSLERHIVGWLVYNLNGMAKATTKVDNSIHAVLNRLKHCLGGHTSAPVPLVHWLQVLARICCASCFQQPAANFPDPGCVSCKQVASLS